MKTYYSSHDAQSTWAEWWEKEVCERENYSAYEASKWAAKYNICNDDLVKWVTPDKVTALSYRFPPLDEGFVVSADDLKDLISNDLQLFEYDRTQGFIIPESDDGDNGFVFVFRAKWKPTKGEKYCLVDYSKEDMTVYHFWEGLKFEELAWERGFIFKTHEEALKLSEAILKAAASISS